MKNLLKYVILFSGIIGYSIANNYTFPPVDQANSSITNSNYQANNGIYLLLQNDSNHEIIGAGQSNYMPLASHNQMITILDSNQNLLAGPFLIGCNALEQNIISMAGNGGYKPDIGAFNTGMLPQNYQCISYPDNTTPVSYKINFFSYY